MSAKDRVICNTDGLYRPFKIVIEVANILWPVHHKDQAKKKVTIAIDSCHEKTCFKTSRID